jgi:hypothetical protein
MVLYIDINTNQGAIQKNMCYVKNNELKNFSKKYLTFISNNY